MGNHRPVGLTLVADTPGHRSGAGPGFDGALRRTNFLYVMVAFILSDSRQHGARSSSRRRMKLDRVVGSPEVAQGNTETTLSIEG